MRRSTVDEDRAMLAITPRRVKQDCAAGPTEWPEIPRQTTMGYV